MAYELTGKIKLLQEAKTFDSGFTKREMVVVVEDGKYPQEINLAAMSQPGHVMSRHGPTAPWYSGRRIGVFHVGKQAQITRNRASDAVLVG